MHCDSSPFVTRAEVSFVLVNRMPLSSQTVSTSSYPRIRQKIFWLSSIPSPAGTWSWLWYTFLISLYSLFFCDASPYAHCAWDLEAVRERHRVSVYEILSRDVQNRSGPFLSFFYCDTLSPKYWFLPGSDTLFFMLLQSWRLTTNAMVKREIVHLLPFSLEGLYSSVLSDW